jgi:GNAT superfamily N-acetyltransferase
MKTGTELEQVIYDYWAKRFGCDCQDFVHAGTLVIQEKELAEAGKLHLYHIDKMSIVRIAPSLAKQAGLPEGYASEFGSLTAHTLQALIPATVKSTLLDHYLDPKDFECFPVRTPFIVRQVDAENDRTALRALYESCTEADLDAAEVSLEEPDAIIFGLFEDAQLVAYAGQRYWTENIADIGVLIHPRYRGQGLGKAVVSALCEWCIRNDIVPMYRVYSSHVHSHRIPKTLGFKEWVVIETLEVLQEESIG